MGKYFFGCLSNRLSKVTCLPLKAGAKILALSAPPNERSVFFGLLLDQKTQVIEQLRHSLGVRAVVKATQAPLVVHKHDVLRVHEVLKPTVSFIQTTEILSLIHI